MSKKKLVITYTLDFEEEHLVKILTGFVDKYECQGKDRLDTFIEYMKGKYKKSCTTLIAEYIHDFKGSYKHYPKYREQAQQIYDLI